MAGQWKAQAIEREADTALAELAAYDPRGRVTVICGRCGQPALSEATPTILEHYKKAHETRLVGSFEWTEKSDASI